MTVERLLDNLTGVRARGNGNWMARCPAHPDRQPSLAIRALDDGRVLINCFAGCGAGEILQAIGMTFSDLYPENTGETRLAGERKPYSIRDVVTAFQFELTLALLVLADVTAGRPVSDDAPERAGLARNRILRFMEALKRAG